MPAVWMKLENIMLRERHQSQKTTYVCRILRLGGTQDRQIHIDRKQIRGYQELVGGGMGNGELVLNGHNVRDDGKVLEIDGGDSFTTL